jgi:hypothetical protein
MSMPSERISLTSTLNDSGMPASIVLALDDVLVHLGTAVHVVGLDGEHFLQRVGRAIRFQRPDFHLTEALTTELRLAAQRLLGNERVRAGRTGVHLVVDQVMQLQHVHVAHSDLTLELLTGAAVVQVTWVRRSGPGSWRCRPGTPAPACADLFFVRAVEHRRGERHTACSGCSASLMISSSLSASVLPCAADWL